MTQPSEQPGTFALKPGGGILAIPALTTMTLSRIWSLFLDGYGAFTNSAIIQEMRGKASVHF